MKKIALFVSLFCLIFISSTELVAQQTNGNTNSKNDVNKSPQKILTEEEIRQAKLEQLKGSNMDYEKDLPSEQRSPTPASDTVQTRKPKASVSMYKKASSSK